MTEPKYDFKQTAVVNYVDLDGMNHRFVITTIPESQIGSIMAKKNAINAVVNLVRHGNQKQELLPDQSLADEMLHYLATDRFQVDLGDEIPTQKNEHYHHNQKLDKDTLELF